MSNYAFFRRIPVQAQQRQQLSAVTLPAPTRGIIESENLAYMQPGACIRCDNWFPTMRGLALRGGFIRWCDTHANDATVPPVPSPLRKPIISAFEYASGNVRKMFAATDAKLFDVTSSDPVVVRTGHGSGNYCAVQFANMSGDYLLAVNEAGDVIMRFDGSTWNPMDTEITGPAGTPVATGRNLVYAWKYRNRLFFIEATSMNVWYLGIDSIQGVLTLLPLSGAASRGGKLLFGATWSIDTGSGIDDKMVVVSDLGEALIFSGTNPADMNNWRQEGVYQIDRPLGMNAHISLGGDLLIATMDGITPLSAAITKSAEQLNLAAITYNIRSSWRLEAVDKQEMPWTLKRWDEHGSMWVTTPGGVPGKRYCYVVNTGTGAWSRHPGIDATCWIRMRGDLFFGTQDGIVMQAERTGYDDGKPYVATMVGGWSLFQQQANTTVWHQARATFLSNSGEPFQPQLSACVDYQVVVPQPPPVAPDPGLSEAWDQGLWDQARWDQAVNTVVPVRNTLWVSIGMTGYSHAPIVQVNIGQERKPQIELIAIDATFERAGVNV